MHGSCQGTDCCKSDTFAKPLHLIAVFCPLHGCLARLLGVNAKVLAAMCLMRTIRVKGFRIDRAGEVVHDQRRLDVSARLKQAASKRARVVRKRAQT